MDNNIKISIVIPTYNVEKYIQECINSLLKQTFRDFEIICIDDGSTDKTLELLQKYQLQDNRIKIIKQEHAGAAPARNTGITLAQGEYIQFLDSDDYFEPTMLEDLYNHAIKFNTDITICSARKVDEQGHIIESQNPLNPINIDRIPLNTIFNWKDFPDEIFTIFDVAPWNKLFKKNLIIDNNLEFQNLTSSNDLSFGLITRVCANKIVAFNKELVNYRFKREGSISKNRAATAINIIHSAIYVKHFLKLKNIYSQLKTAYIKGYINHIRSGISFCNDEQYKTFFNEFTKLMKDDVHLFKPAFIKEYINLDYLYNKIGNKKVYLWGASLFIKSVLEKETTPNNNILGIIDRNKELWGKNFVNYKVYSPEILSNQNPVAILLTVFFNNEAIYNSLKNDIIPNHPHIELLPNIFDEELAYE